MSKNITPVIIEELRSVIQCTIVVKANAKCERLFKQFGENENADYVIVSLHTEIR